MNSGFLERARSTLFAGAALTAILVAAAHAQTADGFKRSTSTLLPSLLLHR
jgi:hypothetical protein